MERAPAPPDQAITAVDAQNAPVLHDPIPHWAVLTIPSSDVELIITQARGYDTQPDWASSVTKHLNQRNLPFLYFRSGQTRRKPSLNTHCRLTSSAANVWR
eukprot:6396832-Amphidinium_carterae.1